MLGAGVAGLAAAHRLGVEGHEAVVYERWPGLGGQAATIDVGDCVLIERYYHHLFTSDRPIADLCDEIGLSDELAAWPSSVGISAEGRMHPFTTPLDLLRYRPMSLLARVGMGLAVLMLQRRYNDVGPMEPLTIRRGSSATWASRAGRRCGARCCAGSSASWPTRSRCRGSGPRCATAVRCPARRPCRSCSCTRAGRSRRSSGASRSGSTQGGRVFIDCPTTRVSRGGAGFLVQGGTPSSFRRGHDPRSFEPAGPPERFDAVVATVPSDIFEQLCDERLHAEVGETYWQKTRSMEYFAALCLLVELDRRFHDFYWTNVVDDDLRFIGLIEHTNLSGPTTTAGATSCTWPTTCRTGTSCCRSTWTSCSALRARPAQGQPGLRARLDQAELDVPRARRAAGGAARYRERMPPCATPAHRLYLANTTHVYPDDRGTNYAVREADAVLRELLQRERERVPAAA